MPTQQFPTTISYNISCKIFLQQFPAGFSHNNFPQDFPTISHKIFLQQFPDNNFPEDFPTTISHKIFSQQFPTSIPCNNFLQHFPTTISHKIFLLDFPKLDPDWLAPHHPIPNAKFPPITGFLKLAFSPPPCPARCFHNIFPQQFPTRLSLRIFLLDFPKLDPDWLAPHHLIPNAKFPPITGFLKLAFSPPPCPARCFHNIFPQQFPTRFSLKIFLLDFPKLDPDWLAPHHLIPNAKFPPITGFLKLAFSPPPCPARFFRKNFPQDFPSRFSLKIFLLDFSELDPDWLAPHHPIPNAKFSPITAFLKLAFFPPPGPARFFRKNFPQDFPARFSQAGS